MLTRRQWEREVRDLKAQGASPEVIRSLMKTTLGMPPPTMRERLEAGLNDPTSAERAGTWMYKVTVAIVIGGVILLTLSMIGRSDRSNPYPSGDPAATHDRY